MKKGCHLFFFCLVFYFSCTIESNQEQKFIVKIYNFASDSSISQTLYFKNHYYCLTANKKLICLSDKFVVDSVITKAINNLNFDYIFFTNDSLFAGVYNENIDNENWYLNFDYQWIKTHITNHNEYEGAIFEDENYAISKGCAGEFGGSIFFTNKKTKQVFSCPATCATVVNKIRGEYFITNSLAHMSGSTSIIRISDPTKLYELKADSLKHHMNWWVKRDDHEKPFVSKSELEKGVVKLFDTSGMMTLTSFVYNNQLYHIMTDLKSTFINKIEDGHLKIIDTIFNISPWSYYSTNHKIGNMYIHNFRNKELSGFITICENTISIVAFNINKTQHSSVEEGTPDMVLFKR